MSSRNLRTMCTGVLAAGFLSLGVGCRKQAPIVLACYATPPALYAGQQVSATATAGMVSTKKHINVIYNWSGNGVTGNGNTATIATDSLNPGNYTVNGEVKEGKKGKEGLKPDETAQCSVSFTVKEFEPPTISCLTDPSTLKPGEASTITSIAVSPQNRPLAYSYSATAGTVTGTGTTATYSSAGAPTGSVGITCNVADDKNHTAHADTTLTIVAPPPPPVPHVRELCGVSFARDTKRPTRVDNEAKACLDQIALDLKQSTDATAVVVADSNEKEKALTAKEEKSPRHKKVEYFAAQRAVNIKDYLVGDQGIEPSRIKVASGAGDDQNVQSYLVPAGASFANDVQGTTPVNESNVKPEERKPLAERHPKKAAKR